MDVEQADIEFVVDFTIYVVECIATDFFQSTEEGLVK